MDKKTATRACLHEWRMFPEGAEVSGWVHRMVCRDGQWHDVNEGIDKSEFSLEYNFH